MSLVKHGLAAFAGKDAILRKIYLLAPLALGLSLLADISNAAMQQRLSESPSQLSEALPVPPSEAIQELSGSPYPGVTECLLQKHLPEDSGFGARTDIHIAYPAIGHKQIDNDIRDWVAGLAEAFALHSGPGEIAPDEFQTDALLQAALAGELNLSANRENFELWGAYHISRPSHAAVSIAFELWNYTGQPEGNLDILTLNYSLLTGQRLNLVDIFEKPDVALELMSSWARQKLASRLGAARRARMLADGTEPLADNFSSITLTPEGICINFQPWQVAPSEAGIQKVMMPLEQLLPAAPLLALWGRGESEPAGID